MNASKLGLLGIFNGGHLFEVPYYQRAYVWKEAQWERFLEDLRDIASPGSRPYFFGAVIFKQKPTPLGNNFGDVRRIIDGQQRMTTLVVFFKVLSLKLKTPKLFTDRFMISSYGANGEETREIAIRHNHLDRSDFERVLNLTELENLGVDENGKEDPNASQIIRMYCYFRQNVNVDDFRNPNLVIGNIQFISIDLDQEEDEQKIFDTINSLGVQLTTTELLKNYFFSEDNKVDYEELWHPIFEKDEGQRAYWDNEIGHKKIHLSDLFFAAYLHIKRNDPAYRIPVGTQKHYAKISELFNSYKDFIRFYEKNDRVKVMREIKEYALLFMKYFQPSQIDEPIKSRPCFERINLMIFAQENSTLIPYVLYVLKNVAKEEERDKIFNVLESYLMRRLISGYDSTQYSKLFSSQLIVGECLTAEGLERALGEANKEASTTMPLDEAVERGVIERKRTNAVALSILYMLESRLLDENHATGLHSYKDYTLEHLMPQKWQENWTNNLTAEQIAMRPKIISTLGNMTILPSKLNISISNAAWHEKVNGQKDRPGLKANAGGLALLEPYLSLPEWNEEMIRARAEDIAKKCCEVWPEHQFVADASV